MGSNTTPDSVDYISENERAPINLIIQLTSRMQLTIKMTWKINASDPDTASSFTTVFRNSLHVHHPQSRFQGNQYDYNCVRICANLNVFHLFVQTTVI